MRPRRRRVVKNSRVANPKNIYDSIGIAIGNEEGSSPPTEYLRSNPRPFYLSSTQTTNTIYSTMCNGNLPPADASLKASKSTTSVLKTISKSELASHNTPSSAWCAIHAQDSNGKYTPDQGHLVLDITSFASRHPGGDLILLAAGKDASVLFETYHPRGVPTTLVKKLQIGIMEKGSYDSFYSWDSEFYRVLKKRVVERLEQRNLARRGSIEIWIKALGLLTGFWFSLFQMYMNTNNFLVAAVWSITMGFFAAMIGTNIQHDGNHGAFAQSKFVNKCAGWTLDMIGASAFTWELQHMLGHHPYTNVLDGVEEQKKESGVDCKIEEKDQVSTYTYYIHSVFKNEGSNSFYVMKPRTDILLTCPFLPIFTLLCTCVFIQW